MTIARLEDKFTDDDKGPVASGKSGEFVINLPAAVEACAQARSCLQNNDLGQVELLAMKALQHRPSCRLAYQILGQLFDQLELPDEAKICYRSRLPGVLLEKYFGPSAVSTVYPTVSGVIARQPVFSTENIVLPAPGALESNDEAPFNRREISTERCFVDSIEDALVWHDSTNTLVLDTDGAEVADHSLGNIQLLRAAMHHYAPIRIKGRAFLIGARGSHNFYHWIADIIPKLGVIKAAGIDITPDDRFIVPVAHAGFAKQLLEKFGVSPAQVIETEVQSPFLSAAELVIPYLRNKMGYSMGRWLPEYLKETMLGESIPRAETRRRVFISRDAKNAAGRMLDNQQSVEDFFERCGFEIVKPETLTVMQQAQMFSQASVIAAVHGAGLSNIVYCAPGTRVIEFYGAHVAPCYWAICALAGLHYYHHRCTRTELATQTRPELSRRAAGFSISLDSAERLLRLAGVDTTPRAV